MEFRESAEETAFRREVQAFIEENLPSAMRGESPVVDEITAEGQFLSALARQRWVAPAWPAELGGAALSFYQQFIFNEEMAKARAPQPPGIGVGNAGSAIILHGSPEQKARYLPGIAQGTEIWCQGFSEPGAGSDLAGLQTRAEQKGDVFLINGQKIWTSFAHVSQHILLLARTDPSAPKHRGISAFLLDMKTPGIDVRPLVDMSGEHRFNQVYFEDVVAPREALLGELNRGWTYARSTLEVERSGVRGVVTIQQVLDEFTRAARERSSGLSNPWRAALVDRHIEVQISRMMALRVVTLQSEGKSPTHEASCNSLFSGELAQRVGMLGMQIYGMHAQAHETFATLSRAAKHFYLRTQSSTIRGGTKEIQRNVIAVRGLGMPRA